MPNAAVVDLGTARAKLTMALQQPDGSLQIKQSTWDIDLGKGDSAMGNRLNMALEAIRAETATANTPICRVIATEAFRQNPAVAAFAPTVRRLLGMLDIIPPHKESLLFWEAIDFAILHKTPGIACDIGGGSVQVVWGTDPLASFSIPCGTFAIEKQCQNGKDRMLVSDVRAARAMVTEQMFPFSTRIPKNQPLVVGSTIMADFFTSALHAMLPGHHISNPQLPTFPAAELYTLSQAIVGKSYDDIGNFFPAKPAFMRGADKLLVILECLAEICKPSIVMATNESTSTALARKFATIQQDL